MPTHNQPHQQSSSLTQKTEAVVNKEISGFKNFLISQNVVGIAVGLAVGAAASTFATSLVNNLILDPLSFCFGSAANFVDLALPLGYKDGTLVSLKYGAVLSSLINFLIIALVFYLIIRAFGLDKKLTASSKK